MNRQQQIRTLRLKQGTRRPITKRSVDQVQNKQIVSLQKSVRKIQSQEELKHKDTLVAAVPATAGTFTLLNDIAVGDTSVSRDGNDINSTSIQWRIRIIGDVDAIAGAFLRHIIFWDSQANGAAPVLADLLDLTTITPGVIAPYNRDNQKRFKIVEDKTFSLNSTMSTAFTPATGVTTATYSVKMHEQGKRQISRVVKYDGTTAVIADIQTNSLHSVWISDANVEQPVCQSGYRFFFKG